MLCVYCLCSVALVIGVSMRSNVFAMVVVISIGCCYSLLCVDIVCVCCVCCASLPSILVFFIAREYVYVRRLRCPCYVIENVSCVLVCVFMVCVMM